MATARRKDDWWDIALYLGIFILAITLLYQFMKLISSGSGVAGSLGQAVSNSVQAFENGLTALVTAPFNFITYVLDLIPTVFSTIFTSVFALLTGGFDFSTLGTIGGIFQTTAPPITTGLGQSTVGTGGDIGQNSFSAPAGGFTD